MYATYCTIVSLICWRVNPLKPFISLPKTNIGEQSHVLPDETSVSRCMVWTPLLLRFLKKCVANECFFCTTSARTQDLFLLLSDFSTNFHPLAMRAFFIKVYFWIRNYMSSCINRVILLCVSFINYLSHHLPPFFIRFLPSSIEIFPILRCSRGIPS